MTDPPSLDPAELAALRRAVLGWFDAHGRTLAFRSPDPDPWAVLLAEVISQQTQVSRVEARWRELLAEFPTPAAMAAASPADVVRAWRGLGYNRRALDLHRTAVAIAAAGGRVPDDVDALLALPGIGPYTARAVAAIAFGRRVAAVDVNVRRVVDRIVGGLPATPTAVQALADELVDPDRPAAWANAVMDLGATICRPARPACPDCPARQWCAVTSSAVVPVAGASIGSTRRGAVGAAASPAGAAVAGTPAHRRPPHVRFEQTRRWLRGRIVDRLRDAPPGVGVAFDDAIGTHPTEAVAAALGALAREGMVELDPDGLAHLAGSAGSRG